MRRFKTTKKYTVNTVEENEEGKTYNVFKNLKVARKFAIEQFRLNNFVSLLNFKRIPLPM